MASRTIRGLTVEIGGDTRKLSDAIKSAETRFKGFKSELTDVNKLLRFDPSNVTALTQKTELLSKSIEACAEKLDILRRAEEKMAAMTNRTAKEEEQYRALQREIALTEAQMGNYQKQLNGTYVALSKLGSETDDVEDAMRRMREEADAAKTPFDRLRENIDALDDKSGDLSKELKEIERALKAAPDNVELLEQKYTVLSEATETCADKLQQLKRAEYELEMQGDASAEQLREVRRELIETESQWEELASAKHEVAQTLDRLERGLDSTAAELEDTAKKADDAAEEVEDLGDKSKQADNKMSGLRSAAEKAGDGFTTFKGIVSNLVSEVLEELIEKLIEVGQYMGQVGMDFGETMSKVEALSGSSGRMDELTAKAMEMGAKTKFSANEAAEAMTYLAQAGWETQEMLDGIDGVMALAATDGIELATAAEITAQALNALGENAKKSSIFADVLAVTAAETCTSVEDMGYAFQYVGPVAGALNFNMQDLAVAIGMMADAGINGEKAGTSLRSLFTNMAKPTKAMSDAMEKYGISLTDANGNMLPLMDIMVNLRDVFDGLTESQQTELAATLAGKTGMAGLLSIVNAAPKDFADMATAVAESTGEAEKMAAVMQDNLAGDVEKLGGAFETLSIKIMNGFDAPLRQAAQAVTAFLDGEQSMYSMLMSLGDALAQMYTKFQEYLPTLSQMGSDLLIWIVNGITVGLPVLMAKATELVANFCSTIAENAPTIVNIGASLITDFVQGIFNFIPVVIEGAAKIVSSLAQGISQNAQNFVSKALDLLDGFADKLTVALPKLIESGGQFILNLVKGLVASIPEFMKRAPEIISKFANLINDNLPKIFKMGAQIIWELIKGIVSLIVELVKNWKSVINAIIDVWEAINWINLGKNALKLLGNGLKAMWGFIKNIASGTKDLVINALKNLPSTLKTLGSNAIQFLGNAIKGGWSWVKSGLSTIKDGIISSLKELWDKMPEIGINLVKGLWNGIKSMASWICEKVMGWGGAVLGAIKDIFQEHSPSRATMLSGKNLVLGLAEGIDDTADEAIKSAQNLAAGVLDGASMDGLALERDLQQRTIKHAMSVTTAADSSMLGKLDRILTAIEKGQIITLDGKALVGGTAGMYDSALGQRRMLAARGAV